MNQVSSENTDFSEETRAVYHKQHIRVAKNDKIMKRFINMFSTEYFGISKDYFKGKKVLDAGCGNTAKVIIALSKLGATDLTGFDLGENFLPTAHGSLQKYKVSPETFALKSGSVLKIPCDTASFDFVVCHGVLLHLNTIEEVSQAFSELARVTKPGGYLYTVFGSVGGLMEDAIFPAVRKYYSTNTEFKAFIDNIEPENFGEAIDLITSGLVKYTGEKIDLGFMKDLLDEDLCVFIQNFTQAPVRLAIDEKFIRTHYSKHGFAVPNKLKRYVKRENIRKFFAPLHFDSENAISKLLYGSGNLEFLAQKTI